MTERHRPEAGGGRQKSLIRRQMSDPRADGNEDQSDDTSGGKTEGGRACRRWESPPSDTPAVIGPRTVAIRDGKDSDVGADPATEPAPALLSDPPR